WFVHPSRIHSRVPDWCRHPPRAVCDSGAGSAEFRFAETLRLFGGFETKNLILFPEVVKWEEVRISHEAQIRRANLYLLQRCASRIIRPRRGQEVLLGGTARKSSAGSRLQTLQQSEIGTRSLPDDRPSVRCEKCRCGGDSGEVGSTATGKERKA